MSEFGAAFDLFYDVRSDQMRCLQRIIPEAPAPA